MRDLDFLSLLSREYENTCEASAEIIYLKSICKLPKGTEYFFSDLHGEHQAFIHMLRSCSGIIKAKIYEAFGESLSEEEQLRLAELVYYPERKLRNKEDPEAVSRDWQKKTLDQLLQVTRTVARKWDRRRLRESLPTSYAHLLNELLLANRSPEDQDQYFEEMINTILDTDSAADCISRLATLIRTLLVDHLHIIGDIFDRGPRADIIMDELMLIPKIDIQWGNHDVSWMGAAAGCYASIATVLRIATSYNCFDVLEDGYGINMRPFSMFAKQVYGDDPCERFKPHLLDENLYDTIDPHLAANMCKAITIIELKAEGQLIKRHPEYRMDDRLLLDKIDFEKGTVRISDKEYQLLDTNFPTIDPRDPYSFSKEEKDLLEVLRFSFLHSEKLESHIKFLFSHGSIYLKMNGNLLFHGCIPLDDNGEFLKTDFLGEELSGKCLMDRLNERLKTAYFSTDPDSHMENYEADLFWYMWCGMQSPVFGKDKMAVFEGCFIDDPLLKKETYNPYYQFSENEDTARKILEEFGLDPDTGHIINGHVPVIVKKGEMPIKANGKVFVIDGGISKAYQQKTGIAGYTLISNSHRLALAEHKPFLPGEEDTPNITSVEEMKERVLIGDTDMGKKILKKTEDLQELLEAYKTGKLKEARKNSYGWR